MPVIDDFGGGGFHGSEARRRYLNLRRYREFWAQNRLKGYAPFATIMHRLIRQMCSRAGARASRLAATTTSGRKRWTPM